METEDGDERILADCFLIQAASSSEKALHWVLVQPFLLPKLVAFHTIYMPEEELAQECFKIVGTGH